MRKIILISLLYLSSTLLSDTIYYLEDGRAEVIENITIHSQNGYYISYADLKGTRTIKTQKVTSIIDVDGNEILITSPNRMKKKDKKEMKFSMERRSLKPSFGLGATFSEADLGFSIIYLSTKPISSKPSSPNGFFFWMIEDDDDDGYEDYTSTFGSVNVFEDRYDGELKFTKSYGAGFFSHLGSRNNTHFFLQLGISQYKNEFYQKLYDSYQILGNNGYYYIDGLTPGFKEYGIEFGFTTCFLLKKDSHNIFWGGYNQYIYASLTGSTLSESSYTFQLGMILENSKISF